jgi:hypothetical protein
MKHKLLSAMKTGYDHLEKRLNTRELNFIYQVYSLYLVCLACSQIITGHSTENVLCT